MGWRENGGGGDDPTNHSNNEETETLLEPVNSPENENGPEQRSNEVNVQDEEPLILDKMSESKSRHCSVASKKDFTASSNRQSHNVTPKNSPLVTSKSSRVPVMINMDVSDRISLNTESTMSMLKTSQSDQPCRGAAESQISASRTRPSPIPMLPQSSASQEAITVATVDFNTSPKSSYGLEQYKICSPQALCGPHPKKICVAVALILSIWASFVLGINIHKKVITMEDRLTSMTQKMLDLQVQYLNLQVQSSDEITRLHHKINTLTDHTLQRKEKPSRRRRPSGGSQVLTKVSKRAKIAPVVTPTTTTTITTTTKGECLTNQGHRCVFPFKYNGVAHDGCIQKWTDTKPWCAIKVDQDGSYVKARDSWDYCDTSVCSMTTKDLDSNWNW